MGFLKNIFKKASIDLYAPANGKAVPIKEVPDPTFAEEMLGKGIAIIPSDGKIYAPCDATVDMMFDTGHAVSLIGDNGVEILIHVGLDTVSLKGEGFTVHSSNGAKVNKGDLLIECDIDAVSAKGFNIITPMVICNSGDYASFTANVDKEVSTSDVVVSLAK